MDSFIDRAEAAMAELAHDPVLANHLACLKSHPMIIPLLTLASCSGLVQ